MLELELAVHASIDRAAAGHGGRAQFSPSRSALVVSAVVHVLAGYALSRHEWPSALPQPSLIAEFLPFELPQLRPPEPVPAPAPAEPLPEVREPLQTETIPPPRAGEVIPERVVIVEPPVERAPAPTAEAPLVDFAEERRRAAREIVDERASESEYLTFSIDDVAPPRPVEEPKAERSIFDGGGGSSTRSVGQVGQGRTKLGNRLREFCNALTGGFGVSFQGHHLFSACAKPDDEPSGLFPEVMPAYLKMQPECVETEPLDAEEESPFPTTKCRLVPRVEEERWAFPGPRPDRVDSIDGPP